MRPHAYLKSVPNLLLLCASLPGIFRVLSLAQIPFFADLLKLFWLL